MELQDLAFSLLGLSRFGSVFSRRSPIPPVRNGKA